MENKNLAKNTTFYTISLALQKLLSFLFFIFVARVLGVIDTGKLSFALGFTTIFAMVLDFGLTQILIRESARNEENTEKFLGAVVSLKIIGALLVYGVIFLLINLMNYPPLTRHLVYLSGLVMLIDSFTLTFYGVLRGHQILKFESFGVIANQFIVILAGTIFLLNGRGVMFLMIAYLCGSVLNFVNAFYGLILKEKVRLRLTWSKLILKEALALALPFAIAGVFVRLYSYMDVVLLSKMTNDQSVGLYSAAYKVAFALQFIGVASLAGVYPAFCYYFIHAQEQLGKTLNQVLRYLLIFSLPITVGILVIADRMIVPIFGEKYAGSIPALQVLILALPLAFVCFPLGAMLNACNRQTRNTINLGITAGVNIVLNLIFIPRWGYLGSSWAAVISYIVLFSLGIFFVNRVVSYDKKYLVANFFKILFSCAVMAVVVLVIKNQLHYLLAIGGGVLTYLATLYLVGGIKKADLRQALNLLKK